MNIMDSHPEYSKDQMCAAIKMSASTFDRFYKDQGVQSPYRYTIPVIHNKTNPEKYGEQYLELTANRENVTEDDLVCRQYYREFKSSNGLKTHLRACGKKITSGENTSKLSKSSTVTKINKRNKTEMDEDEIGKVKASSGLESPTSETLMNKIDESLKEITQPTSQSIRSSQRINKKIDEHIYKGREDELPDIETVDELIDKHFPS